MTFTQRVIVTERDGNKWMLDPVFVEGMHEGFCDWGQAETGLKDFLDFLVNQLNEIADDEEWIFGSDWKVGSTLSYATDEELKEWGEGL